MTASFSNAGEVARCVMIEEIFDVVLKWHSETHALFIQMDTNTGYFVEVKIDDRQAVGRVGRLRTIATSRSRYRVFKPYLCQSLRRAPAHDGDCWAWRYGETSVLLYSAVGEEGVIPLLWEVAAPDEVKAAMPDGDASLFQSDFW